MLPLGHPPQTRAWLLAALRNVALVFALASALTSGVGGNAFAQPEPPEDEDGEVAPLDSLHTFMGQFGLHPKYTSSLTLLEQTSSWRQGFGLKRALGAISTDTSIDLSIDKNSSQSNYKKNGGKGHAEVAYEALTLGGVSSGARVDWRRSLERSDVNRRVENGSDIDLFLTSSVGEMLLRDMLALPDTSGGLTWSMNGALGITQARTFSRIETGSTTLSPNPTRPRRRDLSAVSTPGSPPARGRFGGWISRGARPMGVRIPTRSVDSSRPGMTPRSWSTRQTATARGVRTVRSTSSRAVRWIWMCPGTTRRDASSSTTPRLESRTRGAPPSSARRRPSSPG